MENSSSQLSSIHEAGLLMHVTHVTHVTHGQRMEGYDRQKLLHDVCHQFRETGKRTVVFFGAARFNLSSRGYPWWEFGGVFFSLFFPFSFCILEYHRREASA